MNGHIPVDPKHLLRLQHRLQQQLHRQAMANKNPKPRPPLSLSSHKDIETQCRIQSQIEQQLSLKKQSADMQLKRQENIERELLENKKLHLELQQQIESQLEINRQLQLDIQQIGSQLEHSKPDTSNPSIPSSSLPSLPSSTKSTDIDTEIPDEEHEEEYIGDDTCNICYIHRVKTVFVDCFHSKACITCSRKLVLDAKLKGERAVCSECRNPIKAVKKIYK